MGKFIKELKPNPTNNNKEEISQYEDESKVALVENIKNAPPVIPQASEEDIHREREQAYMLGYEDASKKFRTESCEDCISRESVIEWLKDKDIIKTKNQEENARRSLAELASVTPSYNSIKTELKPCEDCISREAVDKLSRDLVHITRDKADFLCNFWEGLKTLPPVTPTNEDIKEAYLKGYDYGVKDWLKSKTQPCEDCISREQALLALTGMDLPTDRDKLIALFTERIQQLSPVTPERPKGKWIKVITNIDEWGETWHFKCSICGEKSNKGYRPLENYCHNCGAEMSGGEESEG